MPPSMNRNACHQSRGGSENALPSQPAQQCSRTARVQLDSTGATMACLRLDDKQRLCYAHIAAIGARAEVLRISGEPAIGLQMGQSDRERTTRAKDIGSARWKKEIGLGTLHRFLREAGMS
jgi:hypothetical protein